MWDYLYLTLAGWGRFYVRWAESTYNNFGPGMYGYMLSVCLVFGLYLMRSGPRHG